jgi:replication factor A1
MKISDLKVGQSRVDVEAEVKSIEPERSLDRFGRVIRVTTAIIDDGSGSIKLTLWNQDIDKVKQGDKVKITNGYVNEFNGEKQLTAGKFGKFEVLGGETGEAGEEEGEASEETEEAGEEEKEEAEEEKIEEEEK